MESKSRKGRPSKFTPVSRAAVVARLEVGQTIRQASEGAGLKYPTVQGWFARGRSEDSGDYADFARAVEAAMGRPKIEPMTPEEHRAKVSEVARGGNVQALKLYWEMIRATDDNAAEEPKDGFDELDQPDELAVRRQAS